MSQQRGLQVAVEKQLYCFVLVYFFKKKSKRAAFKIPVDFVMVAARKVWLGFTSHRSVLMTLKLVFVFFSHVGLKANLGEKKTKQFYKEEDTGILHFAHNVVHRCVERGEFSWQNLPSHTQACMGTRYHYITVMLRQTHVFITFSQSRCVYNKHLDKARTLISTLNCCHLSYDKPNPWREIIITTSQQKEHGATEA